MKHSTIRHSGCALAALLLATACTPPTTTADEQEGPKAGQTLPLTILEGDQEVYRATMVLRNLEVPEARTRNAEGIEEDLIALVQAEDLVDSAYAARRGVVAPLVSEEEIVAFLDQHWDAAIGGKDDPGRNASEFLDQLTDMGIDAPTFLAEFKKLGLPLAEYLKLIALIDAYDDPTGDDGFHEFVQTLAWYKLTLKDFLLYVQDAGLTTAQFFEALRAKNQSLSAFLAESADAEQSLQDSLKAFVASSSKLRLQAGPSLQTRPHNDVMQRPLIHSSHWKLIRDNRVIGEKGAVLSERAWDLERYTEGKTVTSEKRSMIIGSKAHPLVHVDWQLSLRHDVRGNDGSPRGAFLRDIEVIFPKKHVSAGWKVSGTARPSKVTYAGSADAPDAEVGLDVGFAVHFLPRIGHTYHSHFRLSGTEGITYATHSPRRFYIDPLGNSILTELP